VEEEAGTKPNLAKLSVARTIAATVLWMGKHEAETQPERIRGSMTTDRAVGRPARGPRAWVCSNGANPCA